MGRPREFDPDKALEAAMGLFWEKGFHATSTTDLTRGMSLQRGSLYNSFGDKRDLFLAALERYERRAIGYFDGLLARPGSPKETLRSMLTDLARSTAGPAGRRGCLACNTATEMAPHDAGIASAIDRIYRGMQRALEVLIRRGQDAGEIPRRRTAEALALYLVVTVQGMRVLGKTGRTGEELERVAQTAIEALG